MKNIDLKDIKLEDVHSVFIAHDKYEALRFTKAMDLALFISDLDNKIRNWYKYEERTSVTIEELQDTISELKDYHDINIDELIN